MLQDFVAVISGKYQQKNKNTNHNFVKENNTETDEI